MSTGWVTTRTGVKTAAGDFYQDPESTLWQGRSGLLLSGGVAGTDEVAWFDQQGSFNLTGHWHGQKLVPTAAAGANAGTSPPAPVVTQGTTDLAGTITFGTGSGPAAGLLVTVTFGRAWTIPGGGAMHVVLTPNNAATQALGIWCSNKSPTAFSLSTANAPAASQGNTVYSFDFIAVG